MMNAVIRVNFGSAVDGEDFGTVSADELLTGAQCAELVGVKPSTWRSLVRQGYAPAADDPGLGPANRRIGRWYRSTVLAFIAQRPGRTGRPRKAV